MEKTTIRCPKCDHEQANTGECVTCGLIFARYQRHLERQKEKNAGPAGSGDSSSAGAGIKIAAVVLLMLVTAGVTYYLVKPGADGPVQSVETVQPRQVPAEQAPIAETRPAPAPVLPAVAQEVTVRKGSSIEEARNATVSIETPWGTGSGFFVNKHYVVTNRHVVEVDQQALAEVRSKVETVRELVELEKQKLQQLRDEMRKLSEGPTRKQLALILQAREGELAKVLPQLEEGEARLAAMEKGIHASDIKIVLSDGREFKADFLQVSSRHDLALLALHAVESPYLRRDPGDRPLQEGEKVYTIGSPVGLRHTITSGIFSGYRERKSDGNVLLQTDAPINPGNSGGPLIDEKGYVFGVNTMIIRDTEGIGFAIPIATVYEDFMSMLR
jgi:S1-C subfamily serine protease